MSYPSGSRFILAGVVLLLAVGWIGLIEWGVSAGLIHHGVKIGRVDLSGLSFDEAAGVLAQEGRVIRNQWLRVQVPPAEPACFKVKHLGWVAHPALAAKAAMAVGRSGSPINRVQQRLKAWTGGVQLEWPGSVSITKLAQRLPSAAGNVAGDPEALAQAVERFIEAGTAPAPHDVRVVVRGNPRAARGLC